MNYLLQVYDNDDKVIHSEEFFASTVTTADKIARGIVEKEFVGFDWTLTEMIWLSIKTNHACLSYEYHY